MRIVLQPLLVPMRSRQHQQRCMGSFPLTLTTADPLYVNPTAGNFYLRPLSQAIDSSLEALAERLTLSQIRNSIGLPPSPMLAPDRDIFVNDVLTIRRLAHHRFGIERVQGSRCNRSRRLCCSAKPSCCNRKTTIQPTSTWIVRSVTCGSPAALWTTFSILLSDGEGIGPDPSTVRDKQCC